MSKSHSPNDPSKKGLDEQVYECLLSIPKGKVVTYKDIALCLGNPHLARAVGNALHHNPDARKYPCYKVVNGKGELAENFAFGGLEGQKKRLAEEGIPVENGRVDLNRYRHHVP